MTKFNLREAIAKNKATFFSSLNENASDAAEKFAKHMSKKENRKFTVTPGSVDEKSFDLDIDGLEYEGGSYLIDDNGDIINVSMGNKVYGNINQLEEEDSMKNEVKNHGIWNQKKKIIMVRIMVIIMMMKIWEMDILTILIQNMIQV